MSGFADLEEYITGWAWTTFDALKSKEESKIPREHLHLIINWNKVRFQHGKTLILVHVQHLYINIQKLTFPGALLVGHTLNKYI